jgi:phosphoglycerol transferase MdoB-like AlkP superfamily enzyme
MDWTPWLKFIHVAAGFSFALAHGVSAFTTLKLRGEREATRVTALLDLSRTSLPISDLAILVLLISGVIGGFTGSYWGHLWIWISIAILVLLFVYMGTRAVRHYDTIRHALGLAGFYDKKGTTPPPADPAALTKALDSPRGMELAAVGFIGLAVILWLMVVKPF